MLVKSTVTMFTSRGTRAINGPVSTVRLPVTEILAGSFFIVLIVSIWEVTRVDYLTRVWSAGVHGELITT